MSKRAKPAQPFDPDAALMPPEAPVPPAPSTPAPAASTGGAGVDPAGRADTFAVYDLTLEKFTTGALTKHAAETARKRVPPGHGSEVRKLNPGSDLAQATGPGG